MRATLVMLVTITLATNVARAAEYPAAFDYEAPRECPDARAFEAAVAKRAPSAAPQDARVSISGSSSHGYDGQLVVDGHARNVHGATCDETVEALALAVALAAMNEDEDAEPARPERPASPSATEAAPASGAAATKPPGSERRALGVLGLGFGGASGVGPGLAPEVGIFGGLDIDGGAYRLGVNAARSSELSTIHGTARFERWTLDLDACPIAARSGSFRMAPCGRFDAGILRGVGESVENGESSALLWLSIGAGGRVGLDLTRTFFVEGEARAVVPLLRHGFFVRPNDVIHRVPVLAVEAFVLVGHRFSK